MSVTNWFQAPETVPTVPGPYEVLIGDDEDPLRRPFWQHFNGTYWGHRKGSPEEAENMAQWRSAEQSPTWRGLTTPRMVDRVPGDPAPNANPVAPAVMPPAPPPRSVAAPKPREPHNVEPESPPVTERPGEVAAEWDLLS